MKWPIKTDINLFSQGLMNTDCFKISVFQSSFLYDIYDKDFFYVK